MSAILNVTSAGPAMAVQDMGRPGFAALGLTRSGAMDHDAMWEAAALLGWTEPRAVIEISGIGGSFTASEDIRFALTGGAMAATIDGETIAWNAAHLLPKGATLTIGGARQGSYGYLCPAGGIDTDPIMGSRASHISAGLGAVLQAGDVLPLGKAPRDLGTVTLPPIDRYGGGLLRVVPSMQTDQFDEATRDRFTSIDFRRDPRANRQGVRMAPEGDGITTSGQLSIVSEVIVGGDIQIPGDGAPFVLMAESQTTGGYPRIGTVIPTDMPRVAQARAGDVLRFTFITLDEAREIELRHRTEREGLRKRVLPLLRDPAGMKDLLSYQLVSGAVSASADPFEKD